MKNQKLYIWVVPNIKCSTETKVEQASKAFFQKTRWGPLP